MVRLGQAGPVGDRLHRGTGEAGLGEHRLGRVEDAGLALVRRGRPGGGRSAPAFDLPHRRLLRFGAQLNRSVLRAARI